MPTILRLRLIPHEDAPLRLEHGPAHGWFLALAGRCDPDWAAALHGRDERHPYAVAPLHTPSHGSLAADDTLGDRALSSGQVRRGQPLALRLALADDERARRLLAALPRLALPPLGDAACRLERVPRFGPDDPDVLHAPWAGLADAPAAERLRVSFETPTAFSRQGESLLLPEPARLLDSWRRAWRCAPALPAGAEAVTAEGLRVTRYALRTEPLALKGGLRIGFVGVLELTWRPGTPAGTRRAFTALAGLADFLGTGAKTALGMGQTRVRVEDGD